MRERERERERRGGARRKREREIHAGGKDESLAKSFPTVQGVPHLQLNRKKMALLSESGFHTPQKATEMAGLRNLPFFLSSTLKYPKRKRKERVLRSYPVCPSTNPPPHTTVVPATHSTKMNAFCALV